MEEIFVGCVGLWNIGNDDGEGFPEEPPRPVMTLCLGVELSQLVSSPWLENGRSHTLLRFLLGQGFL